MGPLAGDSLQPSKSCIAAQKISEALCNICWYLLKLIFANCALSCQDRVAVSVWFICGEESLRSSEPFQRLFCPTKLRPWRAQGFSWCTDCQRVFGIYEPYLRARILWMAQGWRRLLPWASKDPACWGDWEVWSHVCPGVWVATGDSACWELQETKKRGQAVDEHSQIQGQKQVRPTLKSTPLKFLCLFLLGRYELEGSSSFFASQAHLPVLSVRSLDWNPCALAWLFFIL